MSVQHGEYVLRVNQLSYLSGATGRPSELLKDMVRRLPQVDRIELKRAIRKCVKQPDHVSLMKMYVIYENARR